MCGNGAKWGKDNAIDATFLQLVLRDNDLISLPKEIGDLGRLRELHVQGNRLTVLPPELGTVLYKSISVFQIWSVKKGGLS